MLKPGFIAAAFAVVLVTLAAPAQADTVVAIVNGDKIMKKDVMEAVKSLPVKGADADKLFPMVLDQIISEKLLDKAVTDAKIEQSKEYKERLSILQAQLSKQMYIEKMLKDKISDGKIRAEYEQFKEQNKGKTELHARHILVPSKEEAIEAIKRLDKGDKFADVAKDMSSGPTSRNGGELGWFAKEDMLAEFSDAAFKLKPGTYTKEPVKTQFGYHVILVEDKRTRQVPALKEVEGPIRNKLGQDALQKLVGELRTKADIKRFDMDGKPLPETKKK